jgi:Flp pilus assembly protein TadD
MPMRVRYRGRVPSPPQEYFPTERTYAVRGPRGLWFGIVAVLAVFGLITFGVIAGTGRRATTAGAPKVTIRPAAPKAPAAKPTQLASTQSARKPPPDSGTEVGEPASAAAAPVTRTAGQRTERREPLVVTRPAAHVESQSRRRRTELAFSTPRRRPAEAGNDLNASTLNLRAFRLQKQGRHAEAEPLLRRALQKRPDFPYAQFNLGTSLLAQGKAQEALEPLQRTAAAQPGRWEPQQKLAQAYERLGDTEKAQEAYARSRSLRFARRSTAADDSPHRRVRHRSRRHEAAAESASNSSERRNSSENGSVNGSPPSRKPQSAEPKPASRPETKPEPAHPADLPDGPTYVDENSVLHRGTPSKPQPPRDPG